MRSCVKMTLTGLCAGLVACSAPWTSRVERSEFEASRRTGSSAEAGAPTGPTGPTLVAGAISAGASTEASVPTPPAPGPAGSTFSLDELRSSVDRIVVAGAPPPAPYLSCDELAADARTQVALLWDSPEARGWIDDWQARPLFAVDPTSDAAWTTRGLLQAELPPDLARYCVFALPPDHPAAPLDAEVRGRVLRAFESALADAGLSGRVAADRAVVAPSPLQVPAPAPTFLEREYLDARFQHNAAGGTLVVRSAGDSRLSLLDTSPTTGLLNVPASEQTSPHGPAVLNLTRSLLCDASNCAADIKQRLAMPLVSDGQGGVAWSTRTGGLFGSLSWLAEAVRKERLAGGCSDAADCAHTLVLPAAFAPWLVGADGPTADWDHDVQAVCSALLDAQEVGVALVVAAGNAEGFSLAHRGGAMLPAAWAAESPAGVSSSWAGCSRTTEGGVERLSLLPAAGTDGSGSPSALSRPLSRGPFVAASSHASAADDGSPTAVLTGTSVAAVVVGAAIAAYRARLPGTSVDQAALAVHGAGTGLDSLSLELDLAAPALSGLGVSEVRVCSALPSCFVSQGGPCCTPPGAAPEPPDMDTIVSIDQFRRLRFDREVTVCGDRLLYDSRLSPPPSILEACPEEEGGFAEKPWLLPQPLETPCPVCPLSSVAQRMSAEWDSEFPAAVGWPVLKVDTGWETIRYLLDGPAVNRLSSSMLWSMDGELPAEIRSATLVVTGVVGPEYLAFESELLVLP